MNLSYMRFSRFFLVVFFELELKSDPHLQVTRVRLTFNSFFLWLEMNVFWDLDNAVELSFQKVDAFFECETHVCIE